MSRSAPPLWHTAAMTTSSGSTLLPHLWKSVLLSGVLSLILGIMVLVWPGKSILVAAILFGAFLLVSGIAQVFHAFTLNVSAGGRVLLFISGAASLVLAVLCFRSLENSILLLAIWIGVGFIFRGVATSVSAISDPDTPGRGWEIFVGVISLLAGIVVLASPIASLGTLTLVIGIWLVVIGVFEIVAAFVVRKESNQLRERVETALGT